MNQTIKFLRSASTYNNYDAAITALNGLTHVVGQPVVALYNVTEDQTTKTKLVLAIGKAASTGATSYEILANSADVAELTTLLGTHVLETAGSTLGHAKSSTQITFTNGEASINANQVALTNLAKIAKGSILGTTDDGQGGTADVAALTAAQVRTILNVADGAEVNQNAFSNVKVGATTIAAADKTDTIELAGETDVISLTPDTTGTDPKVTVSIASNGIALSKLAKQNKGTILGVADDGQGGTANVTALSASDVLSEIGISGNYKTITVGSTDLTAGLDDSIEFAAGTNITLTPTAATTDPAAAAKITVAFNGADAALTGAPTAPTQPLSHASAAATKTEIATLEYVADAIDDKLVAAQAMVFKGVANSSSDLSAAAQPGWTYRAGTAFTLGTEAVEIGDMIICTAAATTDPVAAATWAVIQNNIDGAVTGPASSVNGNLASFSGTTGKVIQDSGIAADSVVLNTVTVTGTNGLTGGGALSQNQTISHATASPTIGTGDIVTGVTVDSYGHIATVTTSGLSVDVTGAGTGKYISTAAIDGTDPLKINYTFADLPTETGKVKVDSGDTANYLEDKIVSGTAVPASNIYAVTVTKNTVSDVDTLALTCTIGEIDGGTF